MPIRDSSLTYRQCSEDVRPHGNDNADRVTALEEMLDRLQLPVFCLSLVGPEFPESGHCLSDGVSPATGNACQRLSLLLSPFTPLFPLASRLSSLWSPFGATRRCTGVPVRTIVTRVDAAHVAEYASGNLKSGQTTLDRGARPA